MKTNLHIRRYAGKQTVVINDGDVWRLFIGHDCRRKSLRRKAIRWARQYMAHPEKLMRLSA